MCKMIISLGVFLSFFKILILQIVSGVKRQKMTRNVKEFCLSCSICRTEFFVILCHFGGEGGGAQNDTKFRLPHSVSQELYII